MGPLSHESEVLERNSKGRKDRIQFSRSCCPVSKYKFVCTLSFLSEHYNHELYPAMKTTSIECCVLCFISYMES